jgi:hypothetical protein
MSLKVEKEKRSEEDLLRCLYMKEQTALGKYGYKLLT